VIDVDGRRIGDGSVGEMTKRLSDLYKRATTAGGFQLL
jgi:hypothetical protein